VELVPSFLQLLQPFRDRMTSPTFASFVRLAVGWVLCRRHTVTGGLVAAAGGGGHGGGGKRGGGGKHFCAYHRVFSAARWSLDAVGLGVAGLVLGLASAGAAAAGGYAFLVVDDTLCRRRGRRMFGAGMHYDAALTGRKLSNANAGLKSRGHCWVVLGVVVCFPWRPGFYYCLPVLFRLYLNTRSAARHRRPYRTKVELALEVLALVCRAFPHHRFHLLADSAYGGRNLLNRLPANCELTCRWINNAALYAPAPPKRPGGKGRRRVRGERLPGPGEMLQGRCDRLELDVYGQRRTYRLASAAACFMASPGRLLRVVAAEPLTTGGGRPKPRERATFYSTVADATAERVLLWYAMRWSVEVAFRDAKQQLGAGQPQGYTRAAVERSTPTLMLLYSLAVLWFDRTGRHGWRPRGLPWYRGKRHPGFADMLAALRQATLEHGLDLRGILDDHDANAGTKKAAETLLSLVKQAA
jgi:hypothetical protein